MLDRAAAIAALRAAIESAPTIRVGGRDEPSYDLGKMVDAVLAAADPDSLIVPKYDPLLAQSARYRLQMDPDHGSHGAKMTITAHPGVVAIAIHSPDQSPELLAGMVPFDSVWHTGLALCSASVEAKRLYNEDQK